MSETTKRGALPMMAWSDPNPDCLLVKRDEAHGAHSLASPGGAKPGSRCGGIASTDKDWFESGDGHGYVYQYIGPIHYLCECGDYFLNRERWLAHKTDPTRITPEATP